MVMLGHSGAVFMFGDDVVSKAIKGPAAKRLRYQAAKQAEFTQAGRVCAPRILTSEGGDGFFSMTMERIHGECPLLMGELSHTLGYANILAGWVLDNLRDGTPKQYPGYVFLNKLESIRNQCPTDDAVVESIICELEDMLSCGATLTEGYCHGDLTFCNTLASGGLVWLIDFLDPFIPVVEMDMAKLRMDTADRWITMFTEVDADVLQHADTLLDDIFQQESAGYREHIRALRALNLMRAFPYAKDDKVREHIVEGCQCILFY